MTLLVGLDLGTTAVKALLCDTTGQVVATAVRPYELVRPQPGWVEQDLDEVWQAIVETVRQVVAHTAPGQRVAAISLSVASGTTVLVGDDGQPLGRALSWMDTRAEPEIHDLLPAIDLAEVHRVAGWPFTGMFTLGHLAWLRRYDPERLDAALIDGCSRLGVLFRILIPLVRPALAVVAIFTFTWAWNDYMGPLIYLNSPHLFTITLGLTRFMGRTRVDIQYLMAMTAVSTLVPVITFFATQRYFIQGIVITGIKG
jgi:ABC-type Fe3+ transport system permease subunit